MNLENKFKRMMILFIAILTCVIITSCKENKPAVEPKPDPIEPINKEVLKDFEVITTPATIYDKVEFALYECTPNYIEENFNPYNYNEINVYALIEAPSKKITKVFGFWYRDYEIIINENYTGSINGVSGTPSRDPNEIQGLEQVKWKSNEYHFRFRFTPTEEGLHKVTVIVEEKAEQVQEITNNITINSAKENNYRGIIKVDSSTNRHFIDEMGQTFIPNGINLCWWTNSNRKTYDYDVWFNRLAANGGNFARIWMATWGFCQHWNEIDNFNSSQNMAARLDKILELADENNLYLQLCLLNHGQFSTTTNSEWANNPYNVNNGGILSNPAHFFSNLEAKATYKLELRYLIARYGYSDKLLAWELFNEVDWTDGADSYNALNIKKWHQEMASFIKENDPYSHMITTSYKYMNSGNLAFNLPEIDFASVHSYDFNGKNVNTKLPSELLKVINKFNKPVHTGEIGIDWQSGYNCKSADPNGVSIRQALWAGMMSGSVGGAMQWWWESWIHPNNLYYLYQGPGIYGSKLDLTGDDYQLIDSNNVTLGKDTANILGYKFNNRVYGYVFNKSWAYYAGTPNSITALTVSTTLENGNYRLNIYNTVSGEIISTASISVTSGTCSFTLPTFNEDLAFIIE